MVPAGPKAVPLLPPNLEGGEEGEKLQRYARIKVPYQVIYDPRLLLGDS